MTKQSAPSLNRRQKRPSDAVLYGLIYLCTIFSVMLLVGIIVYVLMRGIHTVSWSFLTSVTSVLKGTVGIAGNIVNTLMIIILTMLIATPVGVGAAIYLNESFPSREVRSRETTKSFIKESTWQEVVPPSAFFSRKYVVKR